MEVKELLEALKEISPEDFATALNEAASEHYQHIFNAGHKTATASGKTKLENVSKEIESRDTEIASLKEKIKELGKKSPDLAKLEEKYEQALIEKTKEIETLNGKITEIDTGYKSKLRERSIAQERAAIKAELTTSFGVDPDYAELKVLNPDLETRLEFDEDGNLSRILQTDGLTPVPIPNGKSAAAILAAEIAKATPEKFIDDRRTSGPRLGESRGSSPSSFTRSQLREMSDAEYEQNREAIMAAAGEGRIADG